MCRLRRWSIALPLTLAALLPACHKSSTRFEADVLAIDGIALLKYDGLRLRIEHDESSGIFLVIDGRVVSGGALRVGDTFLLGDGGEESVGYRILKIDDDLFTLEQRVVRDRSAQREGIRRTATLIRVAPYGDDETPP